MNQRQRTQSARPFEGRSRFPFKNKKRKSTGGVNSKPNIQGGKNIYTTL